MMSYNAEYVVVNTERDIEERYLYFRWPDKLSGTDSLSIDDDGFCSRRMPMRSGRGKLAVELQRNSISLSFASDLAAKLELDEQIEIHFTIDETDFLEVENFVNQLNVNC